MNETKGAIIRTCIYRQALDLNTAPSVTLTEPIPPALRGHTECDFPVSNRCWAREGEARRDEQRSGEKRDTSRGDWREEGWSACPSEVSSADVSGEKQRLCLEDIFNRIANGALIALFRLAEFLSGKLNRHNTNRGIIFGNVFQFKPAQQYIKIKPQIDASISM